MRPPLAIVAAHPDDEILGTGILIPALARPIAIIHVTDGAPRSGDDVRNAGCATWQDYAELRRREFLAAIAATGVNDHTAHCLNCPDQQAVFRIADHAHRLAEIFEELRPSTVFTHPYEGGHPDHDATAAAVHAAKRLLKSPFALIEFAGYHATGPGDGRMECERFLDNPDTPVMLRNLSENERKMKRDILSCYASQARVLAQFPLNREPLRKAPRYDFTRPPHPGRLYYEQFDWGVDGPEWCRLAAGAFDALGIACEC